MDTSDSLSVIYTDEDFPQKAQKSGASKLEKYVKAENICDLLDQEDLQEIYQNCMLEYDSSYSMMQDRVRDWKKDIELVCMQSQRDLPFDGASNVVYPLTSNAVLNIASKAFNAFFPDEDIYKSKNVGEDNGIPETKDGQPMFDPQTKQPIMVNVGEKAKIGKRVTAAMNYQVNNLIPNWKSDTIQLFYGVFTLGTMYRKEGYDELKNKNYSRLIFPDKIIVNKNITSLEDSTYSEVFDLTKNDIQANINKGLFIDYEYIASIPINESTNLTIKLETINVVPQQNDEAKYEFVEQHTFLDLDNDGFKEPYCVTFDRGNQKVVRIYADYTLEGISEQDGYIYNIDRINNIICYRCIPSFDGSFWGLGLPFFLTNINSAVNTSINQINDSMNLKLKGGGFVANDLNVRGGGLTYKMGEYKKIISLGGGDIASKFFTVPMPEPSPVMMALLQQMINSGEKIGLITDAMTGNITANMAPTTFLGLTENAVSIENSMLKLLNECFVKEIKIRRRINAEYFDRNLYHKITATDTTIIDPTKDFLSEDVNIVLLTDASNITKSQKMARAQLFDSLKQDPFYNQIEIRKKFNEAIGMPELNSIVAAPPQTPQADMILAQAEYKKAEAKAADTQINAAKAMAEVQEKGDRVGLIGADIKLKESQAIKNIVDSHVKQENVSIDKVRVLVDSLHKQGDLHLRQKENDRNNTTSTDNS